MVNFVNQSRLVSLTGFSLLVIASFIGSAGENAKAAKKPEAKRDPLQALRDAFSKGVSTTPIEVKDLPKEIRDGVAKAQPGASITKAKRLEIKHTLQYVAFDKPRVQSYEAILVDGDKRTRVQVSPEGKKLRSLPAMKSEPAKKENGVKEIAIPEKATQAVKAIKTLYPDARVVAITTEVYQDPSGTVDVLTYEIEFIHKGAMREMVASPAGVIPHLWNPFSVKDLPQKVAQTLEKEAGKIESLARYEIRAGLQFAALDKSRIVYQLELEKDGAANKLSLRVDGTVVPAPVRPGAQNRSYLGLSFEKGSTTVTQVVKGGPAEQAGIKAGDKILSVGSVKIGAVADVLKVLQNTKAGVQVNVQIQRGDMVLSVSVKLGAPGN